MIPTLDDEVLARAAGVTDTLMARAVATERLGRLPDETVALLVDLGIPRLLVPRRWGGTELGLPATIKIVATLARGCMSAGWCAALYAEHPWVAAQLDPAAQAEVWADGPDTLVSLSQAASGEAALAPGGYRLSGRWPFVSGCDHAPWFLFRARLERPDHSPPGSGLLLVPRGDVCIDQASWQVAGLRGTGSKTVTVAEAFVPAHRVLDTAPGAPTPGSRGAAPLFRQPIPLTLGLALAAVALGGAAGALELFRERLLTRVLHLQSDVQAADPAAQMDLAEAAVGIECARLLLDGQAEVARLAGEHGDELTHERLATKRLYTAHAVRLCAEAVDRLFAASGGGALQDTNPLQRIWRDVHAVQAHATMTWSAKARNYGSVAVGLGPTQREPL